MLRTTFNRKQGIKVTSLTKLITYVQGYIKGSREEVNIRK